MESNQNEKLTKFSHTPVIIDDLNIIIEQMNKYICKIKNNNSEKGTGFFCNIPFEDKKIPVLVTTNHLISEKRMKEGEKINLTLKEKIGEKQYKDKFEKIIMDNKRKKYSSVKYDITIIEIKKEDKIKYFLDLDEYLFTPNSEISYEGESIYIIQYPKGQKAAVSFGTLKAIENYDMVHLCSTENGSSGSPILNLLSKKIIGIHKEGLKKFEFNRGTFLREPFNDFIDKYKNNNTDENKCTIEYTSEFKNEIKIHLKIDNKDINKNIIFYGQ